MFHFFKHLATQSFQIWRCLLSIRRSTRERERERERELVRVYEQRYKETPSTTRLTSNSNWLLQLLLTELQLMTFSKFADFYISKFRISLVWCHFTKLLHHFTCVPNFSLFFISSVKPMTKHESILFTFCLLVLRWQVFPILGADVRAWTFQFDLHIHSKILVNLNS